MSDETPPASGNRWEPAGQLAPDQPAPDQPRPSEPGASSWLTRTRAAVAGGAAAVLLAGALGGFAVGRAIAGGDGDGAGFDQQGGQAGFDRDGDGRGFPAGPGSGQVPGSSGEDDGQQDLNGTDTQDS